MSNRLFQGLVYQMRDTVDRMIGVIDESATIIACSDLTKIGEPNDFLAADLGENNELFIRDGITYKPFGSKMKSEYAVFVSGSDDLAAKMCGVLSISLSSIKQYYDEKYDRGNFIKNIILDNILPGDIFAKARELHFSSDASRAVLLVRVQANSSVSAFDVVQNLFPDKQKDFVGIGSVIAGIKDLARSFREAQAALEVGKVFDTERLIVSYDNLGIARIIYQLPTTLCEQYLREVFKKGSIESLDHETLFTIQKFFENNLNVSETSRKLFVHRNTLVYRLEKIKKLTGLDLREFDHAIIFKVALMVKKYLTANPVKY